MFLNISNNLFYKGFTLAEVLITLLIIGVVASLVIPAIINDTQQAELKTAWKKSYSNIDQATKMLMIENGGTLKGLITSNNDMKDKFQNYLSYNKSCNIDIGLGNCWHKFDGSIKILDGSSLGNLGWGSGTSGIPAIILNNGSLMAFGWGSTSCTNVFFNFKICGQIFVDVNGFKGPNTLGKDVFCTYITSTGTKPCGVSGDLYSSSSDAWSQSFNMSKYTLYQ
jgi:prepilin-type N-terminal cleavage/methylation domain-containing protein